MAFRQLWFRARRCFLFLFKLRFSLNLFKLRFSVTLFELGFSVNLSKLWCLVFCSNFGFRYVCSNFGFWCFCSNFGFRWFCSNSDVRSKKKTKFEKSVFHENRVLKRNWCLTETENRGLNKNLGLIEKDKNEFWSKIKYLFLPVLPNSRSL